MKYMPHVHLHENSVHYQLSCVKVTRANFECSTILAQEITPISQRQVVRHSAFHMMKITHYPRYVTCSSHKLNCYPAIFEFLKTHCHLLTRRSVLLILQSNFRLPVMTMSIHAHCWLGQPCSFSEDFSSDAVVACFELFSIALRVHYTPVCTSRVVRKRF